MVRAALALAGAALLAACAVTPADDTGATSTDALEATNRSVQMNDVSILLPLARTQAAFTRGYLTPDSAGKGGALLPKDVYEKAVGAPGTLGDGGTPGVDRAGLRLVAIRFDPCFASLAPIASTGDCQNMMRVVFQPVSFEGGSATAHDEAVHVFYSLSREELTAAVGEVVALRLQHDGGARLGPLAPHPILAKQGLDGPMAQALNAIVLEHAGAANLMRFTLFSTSGLGTAWNFRGFDVQAGVSAPMEIPAVPANTHTVAFFRGFTKNTLSGNFSPATTSADNLQLFASSDAAKHATADQRTAAFDAAKRIEDPTVHTPNTIDCASCHAAEPIRTIVASRLFGFADAPLAGDQAETTSPKDADDVNVHMFSYKATNPSIHRRTIVETASIVGFMNTVITP